MLQWTTVRYSTGEFVMGVFIAERPAEGPQPSQCDDAVLLDGSAGRTHRDEEQGYGAAQAPQQALPV
jgi:hypothetical protein